MDAPCKIQGSIHVFRLVNNMCPGKWVHIIRSAFLHMHKTQHYKLTLSKVSITVQQSRYYKLISHFDITNSIK